MNETVFLGAGGTGFKYQYLKILLLLQVIFALQLFNRKISIQRQGIISDAHSGTAIPVPFILSCTEYHIALKVVF